MKTFRDSLDQQDFVITGQLRLHENDTADDVLRQAETLADAVDAVSVTDCPYGVLHMAGLAAAALLVPRGIDPLLHLSTRDRNRLALKSELLGATAVGVTSLLLQRGDALPDDVLPSQHQVFDTGAKRFLRIAGQLSDYREANDQSPLNPGTMATVFRPEDDWEPREIAAKVDAGARFIQTQICLDPRLLQNYMRFLVAARITRRCRVVVSVPVLSSADNARWLFNNLRGSVVPESVVERFTSASDEAAFGVQLAAEMIAAFREIPGVSGVNLSTTGTPEGIVAAARLATSGT
ncbi:MAG: methylenetetrahydrofolate reductase [Pseudomonadota bacterium]